MDLLYAHACCAITHVCPLVHCCCCCCCTILPGNIRPLVPLDFGLHLLRMMHLLILLLAAAFLLQHAQAFFLGAPLARASVTTRSSSSLRMLQQAPEAEDEEERLRRLEEAAKAGRATATDELPAFDPDAPFVIPKSFASRGKLKFEIPNELGVGTMAWGDTDRGFISDPRQRPKAGQFNPADLQGAYEALLEAGINYFDTADVYGYKSIK
eukprot:3566-Heterococcus_DN1.PRE.2